jgi:hypothetical protein
VNCSIGFFPFASDSSLREAVSQTYSCKGRYRLRGEALGGQASGAGFAIRMGVKRGLAGRGF